MSATLHLTQVNSSQDLDSILQRLEKFGVRLGLETTRRLLASLGDPQNSYPIVLVAGTNGKGSTAAFLASMATVAGLRTGLYTSPHLESVTERIRIDGQGISIRDLTSVLNRVVGTADKSLGHAPTYFEALTAAAYSYFADEAVDLGVFEVGLGGRLDATNVADPVLSLITQIGLEHQQYLGDTLESIAREKAGILRPARPAIAWLEETRTRNAVRDVAAEVGAELRFGPDQATVTENQEVGWQGQKALIQTTKDSYRVQTRLLGAHQMPNLALALLAAETLAARGFASIDREAICLGAGKTAWPGRLERIELRDKAPVLLDVAHNPDGARALKEYLDRRGEPFRLLFGSLDDKEVSGILPPLAENATEVILTAPSSPRALPPDQLLPFVAGRPYRVESTSHEGLSAALNGGGELVVICGSVYLVGEIRQELRRRFRVPTQAIDL